MAKVKLTKAIIKKYGISKKAWQVARANKTSKPKVRAKMAKRKAKAPFKKSRSKSKGFSKMGKYVGAAVYGAGRQYMSDALSPLTSKIPLGNLSDEAGMLLALWAGKKFLGRKLPLVNDVANAGMLIEAARVGATFAAGQVNLGALSSGNGGNVQVIG